MTAYYNEIEPFAAEWLRNLIAAGHIAPGDVDERDIRDVRPDDLRGYAQCHFFAGIGVWSHALRLAGWPDDRPVWTGSCPCQPFSAAGGRGGFADERHLWPAFFHLIGECRPPVVLGEQVASKDGLAWLDLVQADMEGAGYAVGAFDLCAAGVGAPHIRQRLWFVGERLDDTAGTRQFAAGQGPEGEARHEARLRGPERGCAVGELADAAHEQFDGARDARPTGRNEPAKFGGARELGDPHHQGPQGRPLPAERAGERAARPAGVAGFWSDADWIPCRDGKARPVEPGTFPLAHGAPARVGRLRAYGNAIVAPLAAEFIGAYLDVRNVANCER